MKSETESQNGGAAADRSILILFAHPAFQKSRVNRILIKGLEGMRGVSFHDLYEIYPDFSIDAAREQALIIEHDVLIFHHPFFWYSTPAILKEWQDIVLEHGWAYGHEGTALRGKIMLSVVTTGGRESAYRRDSFSGRTVREFLVPIEQTARLCGMTYLAPFVAHGTHKMTLDQMAKHAEQYRRLLAALRDHRIDLEAASISDLPFINRDLDRLIKGDH
ncbi:NAD(P)H-dependent oxidoreductase [bacterium]|nr:NAD(P)H-dependent oxidoreductase [bacterium]MBU1702713.1 NAD(P)H-dependent oxidoreductase [Candidatus Eisenbacteria bacterium]MBU1920668.1 NAD(P)H-dependent oxidoreductase [bacterium]